MSFVSKVTSTAAIGALMMSALTFAGCSKKRESKTISASADATGSHSASATESGAVQITCVTATGDPTSATPPTCVVAAPGADGVVAVGKTVSSTVPGTVVLTCDGKGALACTVRIDE